MTDMDDFYANQVLELRRGTIVLAILSTLKQPLYGYALLQNLGEAGIAVDAGTLYPLLRRLEKQGVLQSNWDTTDIRPRKFYQLSPDGSQLYTRLTAEWEDSSKKLKAMIDKGEK
ncbi:MAG TPA: PadR family transcriptional regulator [Candidatus Saccharimonadales bacterium]|nr:PadR family transcriptional regulator [Candidatus Saccharimonadales bacterium]